ncbi:MAG: epoxyqueuosine reductase, partial [Phycisphaerae bacterium]
IISNLPLQPDEPMEQTCGDCRRCVDACPTGAIVDDRLVDCRKCFSYLTIENRGDIPERFHEPMGDRLFGCDTCQIACPHNRHAPPGDAELIGRTYPAAAATLSEILTWTRRDWDLATRGSAIRRAKYGGLLRNAIICAGNASDIDLIPLLTDVSRRQPDLADLAGSAVARIRRDAAD